MTRKISLFGISSFFMLICLNLHAVDFSGIDQLLKRRLPFMAANIRFKDYPAKKTDGEKDVFRLYTSNEMLIIEATTPSAAATGVNHFLKNYCRMSLSHCGDNLGVLKSFPKIKDTITVSTLFQHRYALNYCTYNYTYSFYSWDDWERELDWMALNGINLMLTPMGTEIVWEQTLAALGFTNEEILAFIPGPAFNAWWLMGNLEGWGGPVSRRLIDQWKDIQQKILKRMNELGITPVMQGFCGMVPVKLKEKYPNAEIVEQGTWAGGFRRPSVLLPKDPLFERVAELYYMYMKEYYGDKVSFLGGDLFHEGGNTAGIDVTNTANLVQANMQKHFPEVSWILQGWGGNPKKELLAGLNPDYTLIIDLFGENSQNWKRTEEYGGFPWIWASVNNFGGKVGMGVQLPTLIREPHLAYKYSKNGCLKGVGIIPEGIDANPIAFDWALQTVWNNGVPDSVEYLRNYIQYRYGAWNEDLFQAWMLLLGSVYGDYLKKGEGTFESIFCARPSLRITAVSSWGPREMQYDPEPLKKALILMKNAAEIFGDNPAFQYDLTDLERQINANHARVIYSEIVKSFNDKDKIRLEKACKSFIDLLNRQDELLSTNACFMVGAWLERAKRYGNNNPDDVRLCEWNARTQIVYWGADNPKTNLHDYAHKEWSGILKDLYAVRWTLFFDELKNRLDGKEPSAINYFEIEKQWTEQTNIYPIF
ncbi:MAG: alpha-N-acetylglucosaminidase [Prevotellaceae bacterium]|jgi:alpha-N-acetylglucosaminidase|nr:alpha-N-acetylglucosaminidase [Prevotellaceae bacterium]